MDKLLLVTATKTEIEAVLGMFHKASGQIRKRAGSDGKTYYDLGVLYGARIYVVQSEMGTSSRGGALITIHNAIEDLQPTAVIMIGIAFGLSPSTQKIGDILISQQIKFYEPAKIKDGKILPRGERVMASPALLDKFRSGDLSWSGPKVHFGLMLSGEKLVADQTFRDQLHNDTPEAIGGEMEGAGLVAAADSAKVDWILVKAICDWADGNKRDDAQTTAALNAAEFVLHVLQQASTRIGAPPFSDILKDYESCLEIFFDPERSGAVLESGRDDGTPKFLYTEATGYAIEDFIFLHTITGNSEYLDKANRAATWIKEQALDPCGGVRTRYYFDMDKDPRWVDTSFYGRRIYSFDTAICIKALVKLYDVTKDTSYRDLAITMGKFLVEKMIGDSGKVQAIYNAADNEFVEEDQSTWSKQFGAFHAKVAEAIVDLYSATGQETYRTKAELVCNEILKIQKREGYFETSSGKIELHPHCYAAEGLLYVGSKIQNEVLIKAARRATEWALSKSDKGEIAQVFEANVGTPRARFRTDALAQTLTLAADLLLIDQLDEKYTQQLKEIAQKILKMKSDGDKHFGYGFYPEEFRGRLESDTRSYWTNMFCLRGLYKYYLACMLSQSCVLILAGGKGSRCWPISCETTPKHLSFKLLGDRSLLQETVRRFTRNKFIQPKRIFVICNEAGRQDTWAQFKDEDIPYENILLEKEPLGTIRAVSTMLKKLSQSPGLVDGMAIVSMADDVIEPHEQFQHALISALFVARENNCIVSIGKPIDKDQGHDNRFGHMAYSDRIGPYHCYQVDRFVEKPGPQVYEQLRHTSTDLAWECGTLISQTAYLTKAISLFQEGDLAENLLSTTSLWPSDGLNMMNRPASNGEEFDSEKINVAVSLLDATTRFEDLGVPGRNLHKFYGEDERYNLGSGNICLGNPKNIQMLYCSNNLVISDELPVKIYGLEGYLLIDNAWTNTTVLMPLRCVDHLPNLYRLLEGPKRHRPFIVGGREAREADPDTFAERSRHTQLKSDYGLVFAYNCDEEISIERQQGLLQIINRQLPPVKAEDFANLIHKQREDPKIVEHLIHVTTLAEYFHNDEIVLSKNSRDLLRLLCLYHDFGGYLSDDKEKLEADMVRDFRRISRLDRRLLDSRIVVELLKRRNVGLSPADNTSVELLNDSVNSAVEFLRLREIEDDASRDIIVFLLQIQDSPEAFVGFKNTIEERFGYSQEQIEKVYVCFKTADHFANGRWLWKRTKYSPANDRYQGFLWLSKGPLEDIPSIISILIEWFQKAHISKSETYFNRLNEVLREDESKFLSLIKKLQNNKPLLVSDQIYLYLLKSEAVIKTELEQILSGGMSTILSDRDQLFQLRQILELPFNLKAIAPNCTNMKKDKVNATADIIWDVYIKHRQQINFLAHDSAQILLAWEPIA